ncbi:MAG: tetratricopeptide repeat protein, partial [Candidatus Obscuribacterales bacterium]|nr:tetratricopeptide repeat protein [Candidatus Obscuribacterales bacterium]
MRIDRSKLIRFRGPATALAATIIAFAPISQALADDTSSAFYDQGVTLMKRREFKKAIEAFDMSIGMASTDARDYMRRGQCFFELEHYSLAIKDFTQALNYAQKDDPSPYLCRGIAYVKIKEHEKAVQDFEKAINLDPKLGDAYAGMGEVYKQKGETEEALSSYDKALKKDPKNVNALVGRADI